jgi:Extensin-like protein C-terminus
MAFEKVSQLAGIPIHYDRFKEEDYGQPGHPYSVHMTYSLHKKLEACFSELFSEMPAEFGSAKYILTGGAYVQKPGYHGLGRAFDLDGLVWEDRAWVADTFPHHPQLYLGIESIVRQHFGTVLTYSYNDAHEDHMHLDDGSDVGFEQMSKSRVVYVQNALHYVHGIPVGRDGVWGPETESAMNMARKDLRLGSFSDKANWAAFLKATAARAFETVLQRDAVS